MWSLFFFLLWGKKSQFAVYFTSKDKLENSCSTALSRSVLAIKKKDLPNEPGTLSLTLTNVRMKKRDIEMFSML